MVLKTKEENRTNAQDKPLRLRVELVHLFPLVVQKLSSLIITEFTKYKSNSPSKCRHRAYQTTVTQSGRSAVTEHVKPRSLSPVEVPSVKLVAESIERIFIKNGFDRLTTEKN